MYLPMCKSVASAVWLTLRTGAFCGIVACTLSFTDTSCVHRHEGCVQYSTTLPAKWMQWAPTQVQMSSNTARRQRVVMVKYTPTQVQSADGKTQERNVFREVKGTRRQLLDRVVELAGPYLLHKWVHQMTAHQSRLRAETFDRERSILVHVDFAATVELKAENQLTCEYGTRTNLYCAIVRYYDAETNTETVDHWRVYTNANASAMVHQLVMQRIARFYKLLLPKLEWMEIESDGCSGQFKGQCSGQIAPCTKFMRDHTPR